MSKKSKVIILITVILAILIILTLILMLTKSGTSLIEALTGKQETIKGELFEKVKLGDIIYYDPTAGVTDTSKLTYTSRAGSGTSAGNGNMDVTFTATEKDNKWVVLKKENGTLTLMSYDVKEGKNQINQNSENRNISKGLMFAKEKGYLYAEQELHNICSIYGYGIGAVEQVSYVVQPKIGSPDVAGDLQNADLIKSGARSITRYDIEELAGIKTTEDKKNANVFADNVSDMTREGFRIYFMTKNLPLGHDIYMPILGGNGKIKGAEYRPLYTEYSINQNYTNIPETLRNHIFKGDFINNDTYWLASRTVRPDVSPYKTDNPTARIEYKVDMGTKSSIFGMTVCMFVENSDTPNRAIVDISSYPVRPVIQLKQDVHLVESKQDGYNWDVVTPVPIQNEEESNIPLVPVDNIINHVKQGDIVYYDPTAGVIDTSKLTYISRPGSRETEVVTTSGNGSVDMTYTATAQDNKWVVLKNKNGHLTLMSDDLKKGTGAFDGDLVFRGITGYLYAEQELHNICSIYGYGNGAVEQVSYIAQPKIGSPDIDGDLQNADLIKSGARSMTKYDIEELAGIKTKEDKIAADNYASNKRGLSNNEFNANFMTRNLPQVNTHIPSLSKKGTVSGPNYRPLYTKYSIEKTYGIIPQELRNHIFKSGPEGSNWYWLASRSVSASLESSKTGLDYYDNKNPKGRVDYYIDITTGNYINGLSPCFYLGDIPESLYGQEPSSVRPVVQLKQNVNLVQSEKPGYNWEVK